MIKSNLRKSLFFIPKYHMDLSNLRINYSSEINLHQLCQEKSPFDIFETFFQEAVQNQQIIEPNTMFISTCADDLPTLRPVLLKEVKENKFIFYTNYESVKSQQMIKNNNVAACFYWEPLQKCVRVQGKVNKLSEQDSDNYFAKRPKQSQIGAWSSNQSQQIKERDELFKQYEKFEKQFEGKDIPRPPQWGGWAIDPSVIEFWIGEKSRLHQRVQFYKDDQNKWQNKILQP